jgi:hypothetical protein
LVVLSEGLVLGHHELGAGAGVLDLGPDLQLLRAEPGERRLGLGQPRLGAVDGRLTGVTASESAAARRRGGRGSSGGPS